MPLRVGSALGYLVATAAAPTPAGNISMPHYGYVDCEAGPCAPAARCPAARSPIASDQSCCSLAR